MSEVETVNAIIELEQAIAKQELHVQRIQRELEEYFFSPEEEWLAAWLADEVDKLEQMYEELKNV